MNEREERLIRASEVGTYAYCARAWWLQTVRGLPSRNVRAMHAGRRRHERHGQLLRQAQRWRALAYSLLMLALASLILGLLLYG